jgi:hypothetical protein
LSCSTKPFIFDGTHYKKRAYDKGISVDSIKIVEVIDNRIKKDSIIGFRLNEYQPVILNRPLTNYVRMMLNSIISADSSQVNYIPVKVQIDEFYSYSWDNANDYKFNFVFEYPKDSVVKRYRIIDSNVVEGDEFKDQKGCINFGFRNMASLFKVKYISDKSEDSLSITYYFRQDSVYNEKFGDSINFAKTIPIKFDEKLGLTANYYYGLKSDKNFSISYVDFFRVPNSNWEFNFGIGYQHCEVFDQKDNGVLSTINFFRVNRYYFLKDLNGPYINYTIGSLQGYERHWGNKDNFIFGVRLDETIGFNLFDFLAIEVGSYQQLLGFSHVLPFDAGFILSVSLTTGY